MATPLTPERARLLGRLGGLATSASTDGLQRTEPARTAFLESFLDEVDPHRELPEAERNRRAEAAKKLHMARLALKSAEARRKGKR